MFFVEREWLAGKSKEHPGRHVPERGNDDDRQADEHALVDVGVVRREQSDECRQIQWPTLTGDDGVSGALSNHYLDEYGDS